MKNKLTQIQKLTVTQKVAATTSLVALLTVIILIFNYVSIPKESFAALNCGSDVTTTVTVIDTTFCNSDFTIDGGELIIEGALTINAKLKFDNGGQLVIKNGGTLVVEELQMNKKNDDEITVEAGGWLYLDKAKIHKGTFTNNGYVEHQGNKTLDLKKVDIEGDGIFYIADKKKTKITGGSRIHSKNPSAVDDDKFIVGSKTIKVKRLPKFKVQENNLELGDELVITDTLDLNGKIIDANTYRFKLPKSFSFNRNGDNSEYIETDDGGKYVLVILTNDKEHIAPIGRNPYLPVAAECENCQNTEFAVSVTENVYLDPEQQTGLQSQNVVGETWSVIPDRDFSGDVTFEIQWNAGANGTSSSERSGFNRSNATSYYWIVGQSSQWKNDGINVNVSASGADPYSMQVTFNGMTEETEYLLSVGSDGSALPVEFTYFVADKVGNSVELKWGTATETNNDFFEVQRSVDGLNWYVLETVKGAGTTLEEQDYLTYDSSPLNTEAYYRLRQVDFDGTQDYSKVRKVGSASVSKQKLTINSVYPNPFRTTLSADISGLAFESFSAEILNSNGVVIKREKFGAGETLQFNSLDELQFGVYFLRVIQSEKVVTKQVIKR